MFSLATITTDADEMSNIDKKVAHNLMELQKESERELFVRSFDEKQGKNERKIIPEVVG